MSPKLMTGFEPVLSDQGEGLIHIIGYVAYSQNHGYVGRANSESPGVF